MDESLIYGKADWKWVKEDPSWKEERIIVLLKHWQCSLKFNETSYSLSILSQWWFLQVIHYQFCLSDDFHKLILFCRFSSLVAETKKSCQGPCQHTSCRACAMMEESHECVRCTGDDFRCLKQFGRCVAQQFCSGKGKQWCKKKRLKVNNYNYYLL